MSMESIGQKLREARMRAGIPLEEASNRTKIRVRILEALEAGEMEQVPGGTVYARNFLLSYARFLGADAQEMLDEFDQAYPEVKDRGKVLQSGSAPVHWTETPPALGRRPSKARLWGAGVVALVLVAVAVVLVAWLGGGPGSGGLVEAPAETEAVQESPAPEASPGGDGEPSEAESPEAETVASAPPAVASNTALAEEPAPGAAGEENPPTLAFEPLVLRVVVDQRSWMRVDVDGSTVYTGILQEGQERTWTANEEIRVRFGYAQGVRLYLNEHDLGLAGEDVVTRTFTRALLRQLEGQS